MDTRACRINSTLMDLLKRVEIDFCTIDIYRGWERMYICLRQRHQFRNTSFGKILRGTLWAIFKTYLIYQRWRSKSLALRDHSHFAWSNKEESEVANLPEDSSGSSPCNSFPIAATALAHPLYHLSHVPRDEIKKVFAISNLWRPLSDRRPYLST